jgi:CHAT domain-containing protein
MKLFGGKQFKQLIRLYKEAERLYLLRDFDALFVVTNEAIHILETDSPWPLSAFYISEPITRGNLHYFRASSRYEIQDARERLFPLDVFKYVLDDLDAAIELLRKTSGAEPTLDSAAILYASTIVFHSNAISQDHACRALSYLASAQRNVAESGDDENLAAILGCTSAVLVKTYAHQPEMMQKALLCLTQSLEIYERLGQKEGTLTCKTHLARLYLLPVFRHEASSFERALTYAIEVLESHTEQGPDRLSMFAVIGDAYAHRRFGERSHNHTIAIGAYETLLEEESPKRNAELWPFAILAWVRLLFESQTITKQLARVREHLEAALIFFDKKDYLNECFDALNFFFRIANIENVDEERSLANVIWYKQELTKLQDRLDMPSDGLLWMEIEWRRIAFDLSSEEFIQEQLNRHLHLCDQFDLTKNPAINFEAHANIAYLSFVLKKWQDGNEHVKKAMFGIFENIKGTFRGSSQELYSLPAGRKVIRELPFGALMADDALTAIICFNVIYSRQLDLDLETLLLISARVNTDSLMMKFMSLKRMQRTTRAFDIKSNFSDIKAIERITEELTQLRTLQPELTRSFFLQNLDRELSRVASWVFIPMLGEKQARFILIPPGSSFEKAHISPAQDIGFISTAQELIGTDGQSRRVKIFRDPDNQRTDLDIVRMQEFLWDSFGRWIVRTIANNSPQGAVPHLCIVQSGFLSLFPFAIAKDSATGKHLIDFVSLSYAPSLYSIFAAQQRLKNYNDELAMTYVEGSSDLKFSGQEAKFVIDAVGTENTILLSKSCALEDVFIGLAKGNHWHFSGHGKFGWSEPGASEIEMAGISFYATFLETLEPKWNLRLVMLAACESGIHSSLHSDADSEGIPNKFLGMGALGVVSHLWRVLDGVAALISERFYYYYASGERHPAVALRMAQVWLRDATKLDILQLVESHSHCLRNDEISVWQSGLDKFDDEDKPFEDPAHWGSVMHFGQ